ncbi:SDR family NAD(P)-dependent oxidoreductase [Companilactobacillus jidongensis]|uniref:SDR family NAD(P)-dependent oxidoreductase n=1 Tax=Companilactobacillus jidongensis TaxID=2486006 RepID=UPI000F796AEA|nr:SDR family NAD(P)-dependent oxidoreductase [Companilactobacillus jidongensis]
MKKIALITGATGGIGKHVAIGLAKNGMKVIIHGRNEVKTQHVVEEIKQITGNNDIEYLLADLFSFEDIKNMAEAFKKRYDHLDVLVNNAGAVLSNDSGQNSDGVDNTLTLNVYSPLLLTDLLMDSLKKSASARVIYTSSAAHRMSGRPDMGDLNLTGNYGGQRKYNISKLYMIWIARRQSRILQSRGINNVTINVSHPGMVATAFGQSGDKGFWINLVYKIAGTKLAAYFASTPEQGASTDIYLATSPDVEGVSGKFFGNSKEQKPSERYYSLENEKLVWNSVMDKIQSYMK